MYYYPHSHHPLSVSIFCIFVFVAAHATSSSYGPLLQRGIDYSLDFDFRERCDCEPVVHFDQRHDFAVSVMADSPRKPAPLLYAPGPPSHLSKDPLTGASEDPPSPSFGVRSSIDPARLVEGAHWRSAGRTRMR